MWVCQALGSKFRKRSRAANALAILLALAAPATAQDISITTIPALTAEQMPQRYPATDNGLPDGERALSDFGSLVNAWYTRPTTRYGHGVLGDAVEAGGLKTSHPNDTDAELVLPENRVFEDITPRIVNLDGSYRGQLEVVAILSDADEGAAIAIYDSQPADEEAGTPGKITELARTPFIGKRNRWRSIVALADLDGFGGDDDVKEIAEVVTPHIGGTLNVWRYADGALTLVASAKGFSNHVIGSRVLNLATRSNLDNRPGAELIVPSANRRAIRVMTLDASELRELASIPLPAAITGAIRAPYDTPKGLWRFEVYLADGTRRRIDMKRPAD